MSLGDETTVSVDRFDSNPLISPDSGDIGENINGPSVIRVPDWFDDPLGTYYMYFAHHQGTYIRLAHADDLTGPWTVYDPGTLDLEETRFPRHIASPDVHLDHEDETVWMYFHGCCGAFEHPAGEMDQVTDVATSNDGIAFDVVGRTLGTNYFRVWDHDDRSYAVANDGHLYRGSTRTEPFERLQKLFPTNRHFAVRRTGPERVQVFLSRRGDRPERLMVAMMDLSPPPEDWRVVPDPPETVLWPERSYEGGDLPIHTSERGSVHEPVRELRDPAVYEENGDAYLFYSIAGERGIAGGRISDR